jgi:serine/threonine protein kinase
MHLNLELDPSTQSERQRLAKHARQEYEAAYADSGIEDASNKFPKFWMDELTIGKILGKGGFGTVYEVRAFDTSAESPTPSHQDDAGYGKNIKDVHALESRQFISKHCLRETNNKEARYAIKILSPEIAASPQVFPYASHDMAVETRILSSIEHPNIVKLRACSSEGLFHEQYFIVMDRLYDTLEKRLLKWRHRQTRLVGCAGWIRDKKGTQKFDLWQEQIEAAYDLSSAIAYLHKRRIVYRDLKPENIGFDIVSKNHENKRIYIHIIYTVYMCMGDVSKIRNFLCLTLYFPISILFQRDDIKLFDFGLAAELRECYRSPSGLFRLTGMTGSPRYMAPEVANSQPYNATCDCYSFALLLWEMLALQLPFGDTMTFARLQHQVWTYPNERPPLLNYDTWPEEIHCLLEGAWTEKVAKRKTMDEISEILKVQVLKGRGGGDAAGSTLEHTRRRSTHVFRPAHLAKQRSSDGSGRASGSGTRFSFAIFGKGAGGANNSNNGSSNNNTNKSQRHAPTPPENVLPDPREDGDDEDSNREDLANHEIPKKTVSFTTTSD